MRLGVVMTGVGAHAAANAGVLRALDERGIEPECVCGMQGGAWTAALFAMGKRPEEMRECVLAAQQAGRRLIAPTVGAGRMLRRGLGALCDGKRLERLLLMQTGHRVLSLCDKSAVFPCRLMKNGRRVVFSTRAMDTGEEAMLAMQASVSFAARAAMALPPVLAPLEYMGSALLAETDTTFAARQLVLLGAQRVMIVCPQVSKKRKPDALDLAAAALTGGVQSAAREAHAGLLRVTMPESVGAADMEQMLLCEEAGYLAAREQLDALFAQMGMARCRVLPFERRITAQRR